jgi:dihydroflavonol-4-reductase
LKIVVTGASGHVGANLVRSLVADKQDVTALVRKDRRAVEDLAINVAEGDILDPESLIHAFRGADIVYHLAAYISIANHESKQLTDINVVGTRNVVEASIKCGIKKLVYTSSIEALLYPSRGEEIDESGKPQPDLPTTPYGQSKARAEVEVYKGIEQGLDAVVCIPTAVIGPYDYKPSHFGKMFIDFANRKLPALVGGGFDLVDVRDLVDGLQAACQKGRCGERYLLSGSYLQTRQIIEILAEHTGIRPPSMTVPFWLAHFGALFTPLYYRLSKKQPRFTTMALKMLQDGRPVISDKAKKELGYSPRHPQQGIHAAVDWFKEAGVIAL